MNTQNTSPSTDGLESLRHDLEALRSSLQSQKIISRDLMRRVMTRDASWQNCLFKYEAFLIFPFSILLFLIIKFGMHTSWLFFAATVLMFAIDLYWDSFVIRLPASDFSSLSLLDLRRKILGQMRGRRLQLLIEIPLLCLWCVWFFFEILHGAGFVVDITPYFVWAITIGIGFIIGLVAVYFIYRTLTRRSRAILEQIQMLEADDDEAAPED